MDGLSGRIEVIAGCMFSGKSEELIRRRYSDKNIKAVLGGNFRRLLGQVWG